MATNLVFFGTFWTLNSFTCLQFEAMACVPFLLHHCMGTVGIDDNYIAMGWHGIRSIPVNSYTFTF